MLLALILTGMAVLAGTTVAAGQEGETLRVGVTHRPPLAIKYDDGWDGIAVQLWQRVAGDLGLSYEWVELREDEDLGALQAGLVDVVITAVATAEAEADLDLTHSYLNSPLGFVESMDRQLLQTIRGLFSPGFLRTAGYVGLFLLVIGMMTWLFERRRNPEDFGGGPLRGLWSGFWFAAVTLTAVGYGDKTPRTIAGRIVALFWMLASLGIVASLTATLVSVLALRTATGFTFPEDLRGAQVGTLSGSLSMNYLRVQQIPFETYLTTEEGVRAVYNGELQFFVHEAAALRYYSNALVGGRLVVVVANASPQRYAFALAEGDALREPLNRALLSHINSNSWPDVLGRFAAVEGP